MGRQLLDAETEMPSTTRRLLFRLINSFACRASSETIMLLLRVLVCSPILLYDGGKRKWVAGGRWSVVGGRLRGGFRFRMYS